MTKALIIDDELKARNILNHYILTYIPGITEIQQAASVDEGILILESFKPDIVFLDVEMPYKNGFDFLLAVGDMTFDIVFTTAYNQYAIQAIRFSALDYLLKPIDPDELLAAVEKYHNRKKSLKEQQELYYNLTQNIRRKEAKDFRLAVPSSEGVYFFTLDEILRLEADRNYTMIHLIGKRPFIASKTLKHFEEMLDGFGFIRTHKSHLVNPKHITRLGHNTDFIILRDGSRVEVSRRKKEEVQQLLHLK